MFYFLWKLDMEKWVNGVTEHDIFFKTVTSFEHMIISQVSHLMQLDNK